MPSWFARLPDDVPLISGPDTRWDKSALFRGVEQIASVLRARIPAGAVTGVMAENLPAWIAIDLASQAAGVSLVPLPAFFTPAQLKHAIVTSGIQAIFCSDQAAARGLGFEEYLPIEDAPGLYLRERSDVERLDGATPGDVQKITFTSGTTAQPKGVCLTADQQWQVAEALAKALQHLQIRRHLTLLPLAVLLENVAGVYTSLLSGAEIICLPLHQVGVAGAARFDPVACLEAISRHRAESIIVLPQMLRALVAALAPQDPRIASLKYAAVGGAKAPIALILAAREKGLPVYEGYGLTESSSVVALNVPGADKVGSVGKPLPNRPIRVAADGEIEVAGQGTLQYLGEPSLQNHWLATGDLGHLDADGYLYVDGRKKNVLITSYGRNVSPEWPESLLMAEPSIAQVVVEAALADANEALPDYAQVRHWLFADEPFTPANGLVTPNGRPRRGAIQDKYQTRLDALYETAGG
jgi:long-subunit acyl-CoA synthetase (AMP-forming)